MLNAKDIDSASSTPETTEPQNAPPPSKETSSSEQSSQRTASRETARQAKQAERSEWHQHVRDLHAQGHSIRDIARQTGLSRKTVRRYLRDEKCPDWARSDDAPTRLDEYARNIDEWIQSGGRNSADLFRILQSQGCSLSYDAVRRYVNRRLGSSGRPGPRSGEIKPTGSKTTDSAKALFRICSFKRRERPAG